jgi:UPF0755 protein
MLDQRRLEFAWEEDEPRRRRSGPPSRQQRRRRKKRRRQKGKSYGALIISLALLALVGGGVYWGVDQFKHNPSIQEFLASDYGEDEMGEEVTFKVEDGDFGSKIAANLLDAGIIKSQASFVQICDAKKTECTSIQAGNYQVRKSSPAQVVFDILTNEANRVVNGVTIPEGYISLQIYQEFSEATGIPVADFQAAAADPVALGVSADWFGPRDDGTPVLTSIEGFLFPATYEVEPGATATDILKMMVAKFNEVATRLDFVNVARNSRGITPYEALIAASIIQVEAIFPEDFPQVARVLYNRAYTDMSPCDRCLGLDSAVNYWLRITGQEALESGHLTYDQLHNPNDPYNTYDNPGMPPGAISNPGEATLTAAINPAPANENVFFISVDTAGHMAYAATEYEHCDNIDTAIANGVLLEPC